MTEIIGRQIGRFRVEARIGSGGMSTVYRAVDVRDGREVAIKVLAPFLVQEAKFKARFEREVELLRRLAHPRIVSILQYGESEGSPYIVMPYLSHGTLQERLAEGPVSVREGARIVSDISAALAYAHSLDVVHRDVKPSNILLGEDGHAYLSDFGFALWAEATMSLTGSSLIGTPAYMSPEQCKAEAVDARADQYALAVVLYRMATGTLPFDADTPLALAMKQINEPVPMPRARNERIPRGVEQVLLKALSKSPADRYPSIASFNQAFQEALHAAQRGASESTIFMRPLRRWSILFDRMRLALRRMFFRGRRLRWPMVAGLLLILFAFPLGGFALRDVLNGGPTADPALVSARSTEMQATINALFTANAPATGTDVQPGEVETAVAATLRAMAVLEGERRGEASKTTNTPTPSPKVTSTATTGFPSRTPNPTSGGGGGGGGGSSPSATPSMTATQSPTTEVTATPSQTSSPTAEPSATPIPTATDTPTPIPANTRIPPGRCNKVSPTCTPQP